MFNVYHHLLHWQLKALGNSLDDTHVGLVRNHPLDVVLVQTVALGYQCAVVAHVGYRIAEHCTTLLIEVVQTMINSEMRRWADRTSSLQMQEWKSLTICAEV